MGINYKKELESAAKSMILVHEPDTLIKMIVRMIVQKVKVTHAGILLHDKPGDTYVLKVSGGATGMKIPKNFARMDGDNSLIRFFKEGMHKEVLNDGALQYEQAEKILKSKSLSPAFMAILKNTVFQMDIFDVQACVPSYFRNDLLGVLLLGSKKNGKAFVQDELDFLVALASDVAMAIRNAQLFKDLEEELENKKKLFYHTTIALAAAIDANDHYTHGHTARVTSLSLEIAKRLTEENNKVFSDKFLEDLHIASLLHDIGKIGVPESILHKDGPLNDDERKRMQAHALVGAQILSPIKELADCVLGVKYHHERYDGSGYPEGLSGDNIPLIASIIAVADSYDAMTTDRPYRKGLSKEEALAELLQESGKQFHPLAAGAMIELLRENKI